MFRLEVTSLREPRKGEARVYAIFSFRYDAALVPALIENISPMVHGYVAGDDRMAEGPITDEAQRRNLLNAAAREAGAEWILACDPDERYELRLAERMKDLTARTNRQVFWTFRLREMVSPSAYRTDGLWGNKRQLRLYPAAATLTPLTEPLHGPWVHRDPAFQIRNSGLNLYHLRHASPVRARHRRDTYAAQDPGRLFQAIGYDYLDDPRGAVLQEIRPDRRYLPPHHEDHGLWAPEGGDLSAPMPDPVEARLTFMEAARRLQGAGAAAAVAGDLVAEAPQDDDLRIVAAALHLRADAPEACLGVLPEPSPERPLLADLLEARALTRLGRSDEAIAAARRALQTAPKSPLLRAALADAMRGRADFTARDAPWRRHVTEGRARIHEGPEIGSGPLSVVVISHAGAVSPRRAIASIRAQSDDCEVILVHSGGGDDWSGLKRDLAEHLDHIRLIAVAAPLMVGAARNIGIEASRGDYVAFLAGDCEAGPGWVDARLAHHRSGALSISTAVMPSHPGTLGGFLVETFVFARRGLSVDPDEAVHCGRSYARQLFAEAGLFAPGLRVGEDSELNARVDTIAAPLWVPEAFVRHDDPTNPLRILRDIMRRASRGAVHQRPDAAEGDDWIAAVRTSRRSARARSGGVSAALDGAGPWVRLLSGPVRAIGQEAYLLGLRRAERRLGPAARAAAGARAFLANSDATQNAEFDAALAQARQAVELSPQNHDHRLLLARLLLRQGSEAAADEAADQFEAALALKPALQEALRGLCAVMGAKGQRRLALARIEAARVMAPDDAALAQLAAREALRNGRYDQALLHAQALLAMQPGRARVHHLLAQIHDKRGAARAARFRLDMAEALEAAAARRAEGRAARSAG